MLLEAAFLFSLTGISVLFGFGRAFATAKKQDPKILDKDFRLTLEGNALARRALGWGTFYAVTAVGLLTFGVWKSLHVQNVRF